MSAETNLHGRVAILGSGREGLSAYQFIKRQGSARHVEIITEGLSGRDGESALAAQGVITVCPLEDAGLASFDVLVRSPGISLYRDCLEAAVKAGTRITSPTSIWFAHHPRARTIVITGTKGKSSTATLLALMLERQGLRSRLAGNIGAPLLACNDDDVDWWVIELSSYQIADLEARPSIGVLLNLTSDHLDWHKSLEAYRRDKLRLADLVGGGELVANRTDPVLSAALEARPGVRWFSAETVEPQMLPPSLPGRHSRENVAACIAVIDVLGLDRELAFDTLQHFRGLPHRLQHIGARNGVRFVDDSISSAPVATAAALEALREEEVVLLVGGLDRGIDWAPFAEPIRAVAPLAIVAMPDNGPQIVAALKESGVAPAKGMVEARDLSHAVRLARGIAPPGSVVLLSPGAPSFPHFRDFEDRGAQFARLALQDGFQSP